jgi:hypothetical protein
MGASATTVKRRIFLSYAHDDYSDDALQIRKDLEKRGHVVWFDVERLREGRDWEARLEDGLRWCDLVLLLMTPHGVRRRDPRDPRSRDGYCLNEIAAALFRNKRIIPVLLVSLEPEGLPPSICRIQYLDLRDAVPITDDRKAIYQVRLDRLARAIEQDELDFGGGQARLIRLLKPLDFDDDIRPHMARFHGRKWLFEEIQQWLYGRLESRVFWLTGAPGIGKTAVAARLCHTREVLAYHFCKAGHDDKSDPKRVLFSIAYQISQLLPEYERALQGLELEADQEARDTLSLFDELVVRPLRSVSEPDGPRVVIIDAIDEATRKGGNDIARFIRDSWDSTPRWLRLIITSRPHEKEVLAKLVHLSPHVLEAGSTQNMNDLHQYLERGLAGRSIRAEAWAVQEILNRSEGLFLYVEMVLKSLDDGLLSIDRVDEFPRGLAGHYEKFFERQFPDIDEYEGKIRPMLEAICAQREPLPVPALEEALGRPTDLLRRLGQLGSLFPRRLVEARPEEQVVTLCHKSIRDWLELGGGSYEIRLRQGESLLGGAALHWDDLAPGPAQRYLVRHGVQHLVNAGRFVEACELMYTMLHLPGETGDPSLAQRREAGLYLCAGLKDCPARQARALPAGKVVDVAVECGGIDHYAMMPAFGVLYRHHTEDWPQLRGKIINSGSWTAMYSLSLVLAEAHSGTRSREVLAEITDLAESTAMAEQELGLYALKLLEGGAGQAMHMARRLAAASDAFIVRALVNEFLLTQALYGEDVCGFIRDVNLWNSWWPYHRTQLYDIAAVQELMRRSPTSFSAEPAVARARDELAATLRLRDELLAIPAVAAEPVLRNLLSSYERLPRKLNDLPRAAGPVRRSPVLDRLLLLLFAHPAWEVRGGASALPAAVAGSRPEATKLVAGWVDHPDYRVRYTAVEAAYRLRHHDNAALFEQAVRRRAVDEEAWVRGIVADCLVEWIVREGDHADTECLERFKHEVATLIHDADMWPLESMAYMVRSLRNEGVDVLARIDKPVGGLLGRVPGWERLDRPELQPALNSLLRPGPRTV